MAHSEGCVVPFFSTGNDHRLLLMRVCLILLGEKGSGCVEAAQTDQQKGVAMTG